MNDKIRELNNEIRYAEDLLEKGSKIEKEMFYLMNKEAMDKAYKKYGHLFDD